MNSVQNMKLFNLAEQFVLVVTPLDDEIIGHCLAETKNRGKVGNNLFTSWESVFPNWRNRNMARLFIQTSSEAGKQPVTSFKKRAAGNYFANFALDKLFLFQPFTDPDIQKFGISPQMRHMKSKNR